jgi:hypothetical protein
MRHQRGYRQQATGYSQTGHQRGYNGLQATVREDSEQENSNEQYEVVYNR